MTDGNQTATVAECAWCNEPARVSRQANNGSLYPSCGQADHGVNTISITTEDN